MVPPRERERATSRLSRVRSQAETSETVQSVRLADCNWFRQILTVFRQISVVSRRYLMSHDPPCPRSLVTAMLQGRARRYVAVSGYAKNFAGHPLGSPLPPLALSVLLEGGALFLSFPPRLHSLCLYTYRAGRHGISRVPREKRRVFTYAFIEKSPRRSRRFGELRSR